MMNNFQLKAGSRREEKAKVSLFPSMNFPSLIAVPRKIQSAKRLKVNDLKRAKNFRTFGVRKKGKKSIKGLKIVSRRSNF